MSLFRFQMAVSLEGFVAGPNQSEQDPLGVGGMRLHEWVFELGAWRKQMGREGDGRHRVGSRAGACGRGRHGRAPGPRGEAANRYLAAGLLDEFELHVVPVLLGDGERLFVQVGRSSSGRSARSRRPA
jgi:hypothetical protein